MLFSSAIFLFFFLPILLFTYYLAPKKLKNTVLFGASLAFYTYGEQKLVLLLIASIAVDYLAAILIESGKRKLGLYFSLVFNVSILAYFKYAAFAFENYHAFLHYFGVQTSFFNEMPNITLPLGISFFTFQTMSYTIDVYRGSVKANRNIINFGTYVTMFPQLVAGPIVRYVDIEKQLQNRSFSTQQFAQGVERFILGLAKKMLIANNLAFIAEGAFNLPVEQLSTGFAWFGVIAYSLQIYFDFSGYSDMAIGLGKMFGLDLLENFNYPYVSKSVREFWKRWHISLSTWFKDYLYIPLGGNRKGAKRTYLNLIIVFFITGLWHGASWNFVVWGMIHGFFIILEKIGLEKILKKVGVFFQRIYTLLVVVIAWVFFKAYHLPEAIAYLKKMFTFSISETEQIPSFYLRTEGLVAFILAMLFSTKIYKVLSTKYHIEKYGSLKIIFLLILFGLSIMYIAVDSYNPFIYFRF